MLCPICKVELKMADRQGIEIDYCPQCRGVWLDRGELDKLIDQAATATPTAPSPAVYSAPGPNPGYGAPPPNSGFGAPPPNSGYMPPRRYDDDDDFDDDDDRYRYRNQPGPYGQTGPYRKKREGFLGNLFDFD